MNESYLSRPLSDNRNYGGIGEGMLKKASHK